mmetsp:Transcript_25828/g.29515  ORF Transcript_25828/g.29515 Transcript_25828/m.29515 type:complete len:203 (+) Transcript_25828:939-1547(+)
MQSASNSDPTPIGQWGDNQSGRRSHILIAIIHNSINLLDTHHLTIFQPIIPQLLLPDKIILTVNLLITQNLHNIARMDISSNQRHHNLPLQRQQLPPNNLSQGSQLSQIGLIPLRQRRRVGFHLTNSPFRAHTPRHLTHRSHYLTKLTLNKLLAIFLPIVIKTTLHQLFQAFYHRILDICQPNFNRITCFEPTCQWYTLAFV